MLPLVHRELRTAVRHPKFYRWRLRTAVVEVLAALLIAMTQKVGSGKGGIFWFFSTLAFLFCLLEGLRKTTDAISEEKREGTLGFLFLADLSAMDIILGKLAGGMIRSLYLLLAFVPILAFTLLLGGTTFGEFWRVVLVLFDTLALSLSICLLVSSLSRERNLVASFFVLLGVAAVPAIAGEILQSFGWPYAGYVSALSPVAEFMRSSDAVYPREPGGYWFGLVSMQLIAWSALGIAAWVVPRSWQDKPFSEKSKLRGRTLGNAEAVLVKRTKLLDQNPMLWLAYNERLHRNFNVVFYISLVLCIIGTGTGLAIAGDYKIVSGFSVFILSSIIITSLASQASRNLAEAKRTGAMELLLSTPLKVAGIIQGEWLAIRKTFMIPALITFCWYGLLLGSTVADKGWLRMLAPANFMLQFALGFFAVGWLGMWMGLTSKTPHRAFFRTLLFGTILPFVICIPTALIQCVLLVISMDKVKTNFRRFIAERYLQNPQFVLAPPPLQQAGVPPVIRPDTQLSKLD